jgi:peptidoglycan/xylan/chitin deacetylase (PgdA/CDA1 family)
VLDLSEDPKHSIIAAVGTQKRWPRSVVEQLIENLASELGIHIAELAPTDGFIDWEQAETMARRGIAFGGHGVEHVLLTEVSSEEAGREIQVSKEVVDAKLAPKVPTFSYPNGSVTTGIVSQVMAAGYRLAFVTKHGRVSCTDDPFTICRHNIAESGTSTTPMFLARLLGLW